MLNTESKPAKKPAVTPAAKPKKAASSTATKAATKTATKATPKTASSKPVKIKTLDAKLRHKLITETAHFLSEKRCNGGCEMDDWLFAEKLVDGVSTAMK